MISRTLAATCAATLLLATATIATTASAASAAPLYTVAFLPTGFNGAQLNDTGQIVGTAGGIAALYSGGVVSSVAPSSSLGAGINNHGDVTGFLTPYNEAFTNIGGVYTNIDGLVAGPNIESYGAAINDHGVVGGSIYVGGEHTRGFLLHPDGTIENIGTFGGDYSPVTAINNHDAATGYAAFPGPAGGYFHAYIYQAGTLQDLGALYGSGPDTYSFGNDINDMGQVVGWSGSSPFLYSGGAMTALVPASDYGGSANALNEEGVIVGNAFSWAIPGGGADFAFVYADGALADLNALVDPLGGWQLTAASDINEAGQILGTACRNGSCASVLLSPVPEPAPGWLLLAGLVAGLAAGVARGRRQLPACYASAAFKAAT